MVLWYFVFVRSFLYSLGECIYYAKSVKKKRESREKVKNTKANETRENYSRSKPVNTFRLNVLEASYT